MNHIYRSIWNATLGCWVAAPETARTAGAGCVNESISCGQPAQRRKVRLQQLTVALAAVWGLWGAVPVALAACTSFSPGAVSTCSGVMENVSSAMNNMSVTVAPGAQIYGLGTSLTLTGNNTTFVNQGTVDPSLLSSAPSLSTAVLIGNTNHSILSINNSGVIRGTSGTQGPVLLGLGGMAIQAQNGAGGTTTITNSGTIGAKPLIGGSVFEPDIPVISVQGGGKVSFTNSFGGNITGRIAFQGTAQGSASPEGVYGNSFINAGTLTGSLSLGANGLINRFVAVTGSQVNQGAGLGQSLPVIGFSLVNFAATGKIDGGFGKSNILVLQNSETGTGAGANGSGTISSSTYVNFGTLAVNSGTWTLSGPVLDTSVSNAAYLNGGKVILDNAQGFGNATIASSGGALEAGVADLNLGNNVTLGLGGLSVMGNNNLTLSGAVDGQGSLTKTGSGRLTLSGANSYTGGTTIQAGTLALGAGGSLSATSALNLSGAGSTFDMSSGGNQILGVLLGAAGSNLVLGANTLTFGSASSTTFAGDISGTSGSLIKGGGGITTLTGNNSFSGGTQLDGGTLVVGSNTALGTGALIAKAGTQLDSNAAVTLTNAATLDGNLTVLGNNALTLNGVIGGTGGLIKNGTATLTLGGNNAFLGPVALNAGGLILASNSALGSGTLNAAGGTSLDASTSVSLNNAVNLAGNLGIGGTADLTLAGTVNGAGSLSKNGAANLTLSGNNNFLGGTTLNAGTLTAGSNSALGLGNLTVAGASALDSNSALSLGNNVVLNANLSNTGSNNLTLAGVVSGAGGLIKDGASNLTLNGINTFTGGTTLNAGTLTLGTGASLGSGALTVAGASTLDNTAPLVLANNLNVNANLALAGNNNLTLGGIVAGAGTLTKNGLSDLTLRGSNTFSGTFDVASGSLTTLSGVALGNNATVNLAGGAALNLGASGSLATLTGSGTALIGTGNMLSLGGNNVSSTFAGILSGDGGLSKLGSGTLTLSGISDLTGDTNVNAGTLQVNGSLASGNVLVNNGGTLGGSGTLTGALTVADGGHLAGVTGSTLNVSSLVFNGNSNFDVGLGLPVSGGGNALVSVGGNLTLDGTLNVSDIGGFGSGVYRLIDYTGGLTDNGMLFGTLPGSVSPGDLQLQTALANQINLLVTAPGVTVQFWDGNQLVANGFVEGGSGTWGTGTTNWTDVNGTTNQAWTNNFAVFQGNAGMVTVNGAQTVTGMQFVTDGYSLQNGTSGSINLVNGSLGNATVRVDPNATATIGVALNGAGTLGKYDTGTLVLNAANGYTGGTALNGGTIVVGNDAALGTGALTAAGGTLLDSNKTVSLANDVTLNGALTVAGSHDLTLAGDVTGSGSLTKNGSTTLVLSGANDYAGGTTISAGKLVASVGSLGSGAIVNNAVLELNQAVDGTLTRAITGSGDLTKSGAGTLTLAGNNTSTGGTTISAGKLLASVGNLGSGAIVNNAALQLNQTTDATLAQAISGSGSLTKTGAGALTLTGNGSNFAGTTQIDAGSLLLSSTGKLGGNLTVASRAKLAGTGTVGGTGTLTTIRNGATLAAGDAGSPFGTLRVLGDLTLESGSSFLVQVNPDSSESSLVKVAGAATLNGSVLHVGTASNAQTDFQVGKAYTILSASQINGTFDAATSNFAYLDAKLDYTKANQVDLELKRKSNGGNNGGQMHFADLANTSNQGAAANAIESLPSSHPLYQYIETLPAGRPAAVFTSLSGDAHSTVMGSVNMLSAQAPNISQQHLRNNLTAGLRAGAPIAQSDGPLPASAFPSSKALPAWVEVVGHWQKMDGNSNTPGVKQNTTGLFLGADEEVGNSGWRVGGSVGYTSADAKVSSRDASADISSYSAAVYGGKGFSHGANRINVIGGLAYTKHSIESERSVVTLNQNLKADYSAHTAQLFAEVGYAMGQYDKQGFEPFVGITLGEQRTNSFKESGGFAALSSQSSRDTLASTTVGVRAHSDFVLAGKDTRVRGTLGVRHAWGNLSQNRTMAFEGSSSFTVAGAPLARNTALVGLQAEMALSRYSALVLGYNGEYGSGSRDQSGSVKVRWAF